MEYDSKTNILHMEPTSKGDHFMKIRITDEDGEYSEVDLIIRFKYDIIIKEQIKIIKKEEPES
jgi:hypothetical protein